MLARFDTRVDYPGRNGTPETAEGLCLRSGSAIWRRARSLRAVVATFDHSKFPVAPSHQWLRRSTAPGALERDRKSFRICAQPTEDERVREMKPERLEKN